jgi:hypothetical protein
MADIFISYRIDDTLKEAVALDKTLSGKFGQEFIFFDKNRLERGDKWPETLKRYLLEAKVVLVLFSNAKAWLGVNDFGDRRIDEEEDWVRKEVALALAQNKTVIPLLIGNNVSLPPKEKLPPDIQTLCDRQASIIRMDHWDDDTEHLMTFLMRLGTSTIDLNTNEFVPKSGWEVFFKRFNTCPMGEIIKFNCDRKESYESGILRHFSCHRSDDRSQVIFIPACASQKPESLAKRLILELIDNEKKIAYLKECSEISFLKFKAKLDMHDTYTSIWSEVQLRFSSDAADPILLANSNFTSNNDYIILTFNVTEKQWNKPAFSEHLSYFLSRFHSNATFSKRYILLFVFEFESLHKLEENEMNMRLAPIHALAEEQDNFHVHVCRILEPVSELEVRKWFRDVVSGVKSEVVDELISILKEIHPANCVKDGLFNMEIVEEMQFAAYRHFIDCQS